MTELLTVAPPPPLLAPHAISSAVVPNLPLLLVLCYSLFYMVLEAAAGASWALLLGLPLWLAATFFQMNVRGTRCACGAGRVPFRV